MRDDEPKDREVVIGLAADVRILYARTSARPVPYAVMLQVLDPARGWQTIHLFDNAHHEAEHHEHRYAGYEKQQPPLHTSRGTWTDHVAAAHVKLRSEWADIVTEWRQR